MSKPCTSAHDLGIMFILAGRSLFIPKYDVRNESGWLWHCSYLWCWYWRSSDSQKKGIIPQQVIIYFGFIEVQPCFFSQPQERIEILRLKSLHPFCFTESTIAPNWTVQTIFTSQTASKAQRSVKFFSQYIVWNWVVLAKEYKIYEKHGQ